MEKLQTEERFNICPECEQWCEKVEDEEQRNQSPGKRLQKEKGKGDGPDF